MSTMFASQINEVDRKTNQSFAGKSVETAGPLAMLPVSSLLSTPVYDDFSNSNPFAQGEVDYSQYSQSPVSSVPSETSYSIAMSGFVSCGDCGSFSDGGVSSGGDGGFAGASCGGGGCDCGGGSCGGGFSASC